MAITTTGQPTAAPGIRAGTLSESFHLVVEAHPQEVALRSRDGSLAWTWEEYAARTRELAAGLHGLGLRRGDTLALMLTNRPEFHPYDNAAMMLGALPFSLYNTAAPEQLDHMLGDAGARVVVCERQFVPVLEPVARARGVRHIVVIDGADTGQRSHRDVVDAGDDAFDYEASWGAVGPDTLLNLIYTSGTTGPPKGVQITHANFMTYARSVDWLTMPRGRAISYLPAAHAADRMVAHNLPRVAGTTVTCCPEAEDLADCIVDVRPTCFLAVPRVWEKLKSRLETEFRDEPDEDRRAAIEAALEVSTRRVEAEQAGEQLPTPEAAAASIADDELWRPLRERLGLDQLWWAVTGAAPTMRDVLVFFHAIGIRIAEVYGMSETSSLISANPLDRPKIGSVGPPVRGAETAIADDGEIIVRGPLIMAGYRNMPEATADVLDADGWFHTGDLGHIDEDRHLWITGRKKDLIINAAGKNMSPANIEEQVKSASPLIGNAVAIGDRRPYVVALLTLDCTSAQALARERGMGQGSLAAIARDERVLADVERAVQRANERLSRVEQVKRWTLLAHDWEPGGDELTSTSKLRRAEIASKYAAEIDSLYAP